MSKPWTLDPERFFDPSPALRGVARSLDEEAARDMAREFAGGLARKAYGLEREPVGEHEGGPGSGR